MLNSDVGVVLHIAEATGLNNRNDRAIITASLGGKSIETETASTRNTTYFGNNLVWETDRKSMKRMKTENLPIKLECFSVNKTGQRELIGFLIIPMRSIPNKAAAKTRWHKLIGVSTAWKSKKPEILVGVTITNMSNIESLSFSQSGSNLNATPISPSSSAATNIMLQSQHGMFIKLYENERYIQIGDTQNDCDIFIVTIIFQSFTNLNQLHFDDHKLIADYYMQYKLFDKLSDKRLLNKTDTDHLHTIREKIVIRFRSSIQLLQKYLQKIFTIPAEIYLNDGTIIGFIDLQLSAEMLNISNINEFEEKYSSTDNTYIASGHCNIRQDLDDEITEENHEIFMNFAFQLKYEKNASIDESLKTNRSMVNTPLRFDDIGSGDGNLINSLQNCTFLENSPQIVSSRNSIIPQHDTEDVVPISDAVATNNKDSKKNCTTVDELDQWKIDQQQKFIYELKEREEKYLAQLEREWQRQRNEDELKLNEVMNRFQMLTEALEEANHALKDRHIKEIDRERIFMQAKCDIEKTYSSKLLSLYERVQRFEVDSDHRLNVAEQKNQKLEDENQKLCQYVAELESKTGCHIKSSEDIRQKLTDLQHELDIRNERIDHLEKSKQYYKEQWAIMIREWNKYDNNGPLPFVSHHMEIDQIQSSYNRLSNFSENCIHLSEVLNEERNALHSDRKELENVRNCLS